MFIGPCIIVITEKKLDATYCTSYRLNIFQALLCPSSGGYSLQPGHYSSLTAPNLQHTANQERNDQCGNQHHSHELLMMGIVVPETC